MVMDNSIYKQLCVNLEQLKLPQMALHLEEVSGFVNSNSISFSEGLLKPSSYEVDFQAKKAACSMIKAAAFPFIKEIKDYESGFQPDASQQKIMELSTLRFIENAENIVFLGTSGVGKTHLATSTGIEAAKKDTALILLNVQTCCTS